MERAAQNVFLVLLSICLQISTYHALPAKSATQMDYDSDSWSTHTPYIKRTIALDECTVYSMARPGYYLAMASSLNNYQPYMKSGNPRYNNTKVNDWSGIWRIVKVNSTSDTNYQLWNYERKCSLSFSECKNIFSLMMSKMFDSWTCEDYTMWHIDITNFKEIHKDGIVTAIKLPRNPAGYLHAATDDVIMADEFYWGGHWSIICRNDPRF
ncbi:Hypothetical predicted protein [Cloeon dipterum]|uniref:Uncharacterized protein n=1 Tax=Cloeon dipterum TaxID=197152 RepID=A0A8S1C2L4_9INSE|nr:Hypothetical predicted protein [Cloeon dipterum]